MPKPKFIFETPEDKVKRLMFLETLNPKEIKTIKNMLISEQAFFIQKAGFTQLELLVFTLKTYGLTNKEILDVLSTDYNQNIELRSFTTLFKKLVDKMRNTILKLTI